MTVYALSIPAQWIYQSYKGIFLGGLLCQKISKELFPELEIKNPRSAPEIDK